MENSYGLVAALRTMLHRKSFLESKERRSRRFISFPYMNISFQAVRRSRSGHLELWCDTLCTSCWCCKFQFDVSESAIGHCDTPIFQLPFDDEHVPTLFRKIKCKF